jgi:hypothetical protein
MATRPPPPAGKKFSLIGDYRRADKALSERVLASKNGAIGV